VKGTGLTGKKTVTEGDEHLRGEDHVAVAAGLPCALRVSAVAAVGGRCRGESCAPADPPAAPPPPLGGVVVDAVVFVLPSSPAPPPPPPSLARASPPPRAQDGAAGIFPTASPSMICSRASTGQGEGKGWDWAGIGILGGLNRTTKKIWGGILPGPGVPRGLGRIPGREGLNRTKPQW
jgi:hypothetical protein